jgi:hypothetical protein
MGAAIASRILKLVAVLLGLALSGTISAEIHYRWVDEHGIPVHSDRPPPPGIDYQEISHGTALKQPLEAEKDAESERIELRITYENEDIPKIEVPPEKDPKRCQRARDNLETLTLARVRQRDGGYKYLSEEEKETERQKAREAIEAYCE